MKFVCDKCKTKYSIADEKVRRKVLKIRCKNCANIIVVRDPSRVEGSRVEGSQAAKLPQRRSDPLEQAFDGAFGAGAGAGGGLRRRRSSTGHRALAVARATEPALDEHIDEFDEGADQTRVSAGPDLEDEWYLSVDSQQFGPMSFDELGSRVKRGEARGDDAYVWRDGFDDWLEVSKVPELRPFAPPPPPPQRSGLFPSTEVEKSLGEAPPARPSAPPAPPVPPAAPPPPPAVASARSSQEVSSPVIAPPLLSPPEPKPAAAAIVPAPPPPAAAAPPAAPAPAPGPAPEAPVPAALAQGISQLPASYGDRPEATLPPAMVPAAPVSPKTPALMKVAAIAGILSTLTGVIILVYFLFIERPATHHARRQGPDLKRLAAATGDKARTVTPELKPDAGTVKLEFPAVDVQRTVRGKAPRKVARRAGTPAAKVPAKADPASKLSAKERRLLAAMGGNVGGSAVPKARKGKGRSLRPQRQIKGNEIATLQRKHRFALKACYQRSLKRDNSLKEVRAEIRIDVGSSGIVRSVKVGKVSDFALRTCLSRTVKRWVFKPVGGRGTTVEFPLIFRGS